MLKSSKKEEPNSQFKKKLTLNPKSVNQTEWNHYYLDNSPKRKKIYHNLFTIISLQIHFCSSLKHK